MDVQPSDLAQEITRLQRCVNDLVSALALPAMWSGGEPSQIVHTLLDALLRMLQLDLVYVRLKETRGQAPIEMVRFAQSQKTKAPPHEIGNLVKQWMGTALQEWPRLIRSPLADRDISIVPLGLGLQGEIGVLVAGSERGDFPRQTERTYSERSSESGIHRVAGGTTSERTEAGSKRARSKRHPTNCRTCRGQRRAAKGNCRSQARRGRSEK